MKELESNIKEKISRHLNITSIDPEVKKKRKTVPVQMYYNGKIIATSRGRKMMWNSIGAAKSALRCNYNNFVYRLVASEFTRESTTFYSNSKKEIVTRDVVDQFEEDIWEFIFSQVEFRPLQ